MISDSFINALKLLIIAVGIIVTGYISAKNAPKLFSGGELPDNLEAPVTADRSALEGDTWSPAMLAPVSAMELPAVQVAESSDAILITAADQASMDKRSRTLDQLEVAQMPVYEANPQNRMSGRDWDLALVAVSGRLPSETKPEPQYVDPLTGQPSRPDWHGTPLFPESFPTRRYLKGPQLRLVFVRTGASAWESYPDIQVYDAVTMKLVSSGTRMKVARLNKEEPRRNERYEEAISYTVDLNIWHSTPLKVCFVERAGMGAEVDMAATPGAQAQLGPAALQVAWAGWRMPGGKSGEVVDTSGPVSLQASEDHGSVILRATPRYTHFLEAAVFDSAGNRARLDDMRGSESFQQMFFAKHPKVLPYHLSPSAPMLGSGSLVLKVQEHIPCRVMMKVQGIPKLATAEEAGITNLFDMPIPYLQLSSTTTIEDLAEIVAAAGEFKLDISGYAKREHLLGSEDHEFRDVTPAMLLQEMGKSAKKIAYRVDLETMTLIVRDPRNGIGHIDTFQE